jgi:hypothetical protein
MTFVEHRAHPVMRTTLKPFWLLARAAIQEGDFSKETLASYRFRSAQHSQSSIDDRLAVQRPTKPTRWPSWRNIRILLHTIGANW